MKKILLFVLLTVLKFTAQSQTCSVTIQQPDTLICLGRSVTLTASGTGNAPLSYTWTPAAGLNTDTGKTVIATPNATTTYTIKISSANGCTSSKSVTIMVQNCPLKADFSASITTACSTPAVISFTDLSTGNPTSWHWDFGNGSTSTLQNVAVTYLNPGTYSVKLVAGKGSNRDSVLKIVTISQGTVPSFSFEVTDTCSIFSRTFHFINTTSKASSYTWDFGDGNTALSFEPSHTYLYEGNYSVSLIAEDINGCRATLVKKNIQVQTYKPILPAAGALTLHATSECTDSAGWTNYFNDNSTPQNTSDDILLLSLKKNGNNIGTTGNSAFDISVSATKGAGSNTGILLTNPLISNPSGFWVMNRYWQVKPITQPTAPVSVRFYFNAQDLTDVNGSYPNHNLKYTDLLFYKTIGGNADPTTNLQGATRIISLINGAAPDTTHWVYTRLDSIRQMAEFTVSSFSGGGGGATGNGLVLPLQLLSFTAVQQLQDVMLRWSVASTADIEKYIVEKSLTGQDFTPAYTVLAANAINKTSFTYLDVNAVDGAKNIFYRIKMQNKNGSFSYSNVEAISTVNNSYGITIAPNPVKNFITVHSTLSTSLQLLLFDNMGRKILTIPVANGVNERVDLPKLQNGCYHLQLIDKSKQVYNQNILIVN